MQTQINFKPSVFMLHTVDNWIKSSCSFKSLSYLIFYFTDALPVVAKLVPPSNLSINKSSEGILLWWSVPKAQSPPIDSFVVQSRLEGGEWINLKENISPVENQIFLPGLCKVNVVEDMIWDFYESVSLSFLINATLSSFSFILILLFFSRCITLWRTASMN